MGKSSHAKELRRYVKYRISAFFNSLLYNISPAYRVGIDNQRILNEIFLNVARLKPEDSSLESGERMVIEELKDADAAHLKRYEFAKTLIKDGDRVLDIACGVGYGTYLMAENSKIKATGVDVSPGAIEYAKKHYNRKNTEFICASAESYETEELFDVIVSFETIEHLKNDEEFIRKLGRFLKPGGSLISSTPNELVLPYSIINHPFHYRHYTPRRMTHLLRKLAGVKVENVYTQRPSIEYNLTKSLLGIYTVHVSRKN